MRRRPLTDAVPRLVGALGCGLAVSLAFPPYDLPWLMPAGLAGLMVLVRHASRGLALGMIFGLGFMVPLLRWLTIIGVDAWFALSVLEAVFFGAMTVLWRSLAHRRSWPVVYAVSWAGFEVLRGVIPFGGFPWGTLAFGLVDSPVVRYGRLGGTVLVSLVVVGAVAVAVDLVERRDRSPIGILMALSAVALVAVSALLPVGIAGVGHSVRVAAIQGNVPGEGMDPFAERRKVLDNHAETTRAYAAQVTAGERPAPDIVIWPENSTDIDPYADTSAYDEIDQAVRAIGVPTLVGAVVDGPTATQVQNMGIVWDPTTGPGAQYIKRHPVPFGEYIPFRGLLTRFISRLDQIPRDFARGDRAGVLQLGPVKVGDVICFEVAYDGLVRDVVNAGGQLLVVQTNNATYTGTGQLEQQFAISRYRAIETGRTVVVAATNGISGVISPSGRVVERSQQRTRAVLEQTVTLGEDATLGVRLGWWLELLAVLATASLVVAGLLERRRRTGTMGG
ncbi:MAG: apolipoprotein N-acyltransferase [Nocardioidaceae bacterium]|nr:apolipoprotein N-acyltransferase [Nocardioidaceae bacterium]